MAANILILLYPCLLDYYVCLFSVIKEIFIYYAVTKFYQFLRLTNTTNIVSNIYRLVKFNTHVLCEVRCDGGCNESCARSDSVRDTHQSSGVLRSNVHVVDEVTGVDEPADGDGER